MVQIGIVEKRLVAAGILIGQRICLGMFQHQEISLMISGFINMHGCGTNCGEKGSSNINTERFFFSGLPAKGL